MNDFAFLSDDIVFNVLEFAHFERLRGNDVTMRLGGRWGEIAHKFRGFKLDSNEIEETGLDGLSVSFTAAEKNRRNVAINRICLYAIREFNEIEHLAANAYESLEIYCKVVPREFLENLGTRFTKIVWFIGNEHETNDFLNGDAEIDFLKRQLKSPHLRILEYDRPVLARPEFTDLLVHFVQKKNFETLKVTPLSAFFSISERVFLAAYDAWRQRRDCEHRRSSICAWISTENHHKLTARIPNCSWNERIQNWGPEWIYSEKHPTADHYEMLMFYNDNNASSNFKAMTMSLSRGDIKYSR